MLKYRIRLCSGLEGQIKLLAGIFGYPGLDLAVGLIQKVPPKGSD